MSLPMSQSNFNNAVQAPQDHENPSNQTRQGPVEAHSPGRIGYTEDHYMMYQSAMRERGLRDPSILTPTVRQDLKRSLYEVQREYLTKVTGIDFSGHTEFDNRTSSYPGEIYVSGRSDTHVSSSILEPPPSVHTVHSRDRILALRRTGTDLNLNLRTNHHHHHHHHQGKFSSLWISNKSGNNTFEARHIPDQWTTITQTWTDGGLQVEAYLRRDMFGTIQIRFKSLQQTSMALIRILQPGMGRSMVQ
ncbi:hypothetical protein L218DRAFT_951801 [Marasmius fiardii PR-910]|nr:hypothetical protein L218DRAFT_951801 [Marasmius fiardii PR-910]